MGFIKLILRIIFKFILNTIYKNLKVTKIFLKKDFKLGPSFKDYFFAIVIIFILNLVKTDLFMENKARNKIWLDLIVCIILK